MSPIPIKNAVIPKHKNIFARLYYGELSLPVTFWAFGVLIPLVQCGLSLYLEYYIQSPAAKTFIFEHSPLTVCMLIVLTLISYGWCYVVFVGQWRAAKKYRGRKIWAFLVKMYVALWSFGIVIGLFDLETLVALIILFHI